MTHPLVRAVREALERASDPVKAPQMQAYMKSAMPYRGVSSAMQKALWKQIFPAHPLHSRAVWRRVALDLWRNAAFREERYAAIALTGLRAYAPYRTFAAVPMFEEMIASGAWWDVVDAIATHQLGDVLRADRAPMSRQMRRWARDLDLWKRRAAILCQIRFKRDTDLDLLYDCIEPNLIDLRRRGASGTMSGARSRRKDVRDDFFIRKAIGWALRQYAWVDPREVQRYVKEKGARLSPLSVRESLRNL